MNKRALDFKQVSENTKEGKPSERDRRPFFAAYFEGYSQESLKPQNIDWIVFLASTYILELDAGKDFAPMAKVLPEDDPNSKNLKQGILSIAKDETRHAAYLYLEQHSSHTVISDELETSPGSATLKPGDSSEPYI